MPNFGFILQALKYAPMVMGAVQQFRAQKSEHAEAEAEMSETRQTLDDMRKEMNRRLETVEHDNAQLKTRLRDAESSVMLLTVLLWSVGGFALAAFVVAIIALVHHG